MALNFTEIGAALVAQGQLTTQHKILAVDEAIYKLMNAGESYSVEGRQKSSARLNDLREYRKELVAQLADEQAAAVGEDPTMMNIGFGQPH